MSNTKEFSKQRVDAWLSGEHSGYYPGWQHSIINPVRKWLLERANGKCEECGWCVINPHTNKVPLQIHHIDGDSENARPSNLKVLCPNCHSLTDNFGKRKKSTRVARPNKFVL